MAAHTTRVRDRNGLAISLRDPQESRSTIKLWFPVAIIILLLAEFCAGESATG
jgi:hypothetical protein